MNYNLRNGEFSDSLFDLFQLIDKYYYSLLSQIDPGVNFCNSINSQL